MVEIGQEMKTLNKKEVSMGIQNNKFVGFKKCKEKTFPSMVFIGVSLNF